MGVPLLSMMRRVTQPIRVAIVNDYEIVVRGLAAMLEHFSDRIQIVELDSRRPVVSDVDVALYDTFGQAQGTAIDLDDVLTPGSASRLLVYSWNHSERVIRESFASGAHGYVPKTISGEDLVRAIERVHAGEQVRPDLAEDREVEGDVGAWPGADSGLTPRESEVLALICQGFTNEEICKRTYITLNTLKGYVRTLYRKIEVSDRANAILWGVDHGFRPDRSRQIRDR